MLMMNNPHFPFDEGLGGPAPALEVVPPADVSGQTVYLPADFRPSRNDVICSRGSVSFHHASNARLRELIDASLEEYEGATTKGGRSQIVTMIIEVLQQERGGMFVRQDNKTKLWYQVSQRAMREKVGQAIRAALKRKHTIHNSNVDDVLVHPDDAPLRKEPPQIYLERFLPESYSEEQKLPSLSETSRTSLAISPTTFSRRLLQLREDPPTIEQYPHYGLNQAAAAPAAATTLNVSIPIHVAATEKGNADETRKRLLEYAVANRKISEPTSFGGTHYQQQQPNTTPFDFDPSQSTTSRRGLVLGNDAFARTDALPHGIPLSLSGRFRTVAAMDNTTVLISDNCVQTGESRHGCTDTRGIADISIQGDVLGLDPLGEDESQVGTRWYPTS